MKRFKILYNKYLIISIGLVFINLLFGGCYSLREVNIENNESTIKVYKIETLDGKVIDFQNSKLGYAVLSDNEIIVINLMVKRKYFQCRMLKNIILKNMIPGKQFY